MRRAAIKAAPVAQLKPDDELALTVAVGYARQALIALGAAEHPRANRARQDFDDLCKAEALLDGALEIVRAHKDKLAVKL